MLLSTLVLPWRLPLFLISLILITLGLRPYRVLAQLEIRPHEFSYDGSVYTFSQKGKPLFTLREEHIAEMKFVEKEQHYGIAIQLSGNVEPLKEFDIPAFVADSRARMGYDLFLPYFTEKSFQTFTLRLL